MKTIVITGVSTGIGLGTARAFLDRGYKVYGSVRKQADADRLKRELGPHFHPLKFDITNEAEIAAAAETVREELGEEKLTGLVNNAGIATSGTMLQQPLDEIRQQFEVNVYGQLAVTKAFVDLLKPRNESDHGGRIVMISSIGGKISGPFLGAYSASKHALEGMSNSLRRELLPYAIDVVIIGPGPVKSAIWDKDSAVDLSQVEGTPYEEPARRLQKHVVGGGRNGTPIDVFGMKVLSIFEKRSPKARYSIVKGRLVRWTLPRVLPPRVVDRIVRDKFALSPRKK